MLGKKTITNTPPVTGTALDSSCSTAQAYSSTKGGLGQQRGCCRGLMHSLTCFCLDFSILPYSDNHRKYHSLLYAWYLSGLKGHSPVSLAEVGVIASPSADGVISTADRAEESPGIGS